MTTVNLKALRHHHAIPAALRGQQGRPIIWVETPYGKVEEGCFHRINTVFSNTEVDRGQLEELLLNLATEYETHVKLAEGVLAGMEVPTGDALTEAFDQFLKGDIIVLNRYFKEHPKEAKLIRSFTHGVVEAVGNGVIRLKRDNNGSRVTMSYGLKTKLSPGDHVFVRDDGAKGVPEVLAVWVGVKEASIRAEELKQFV